MIKLIIILLFSYNLFGLDNDYNECKTKLFFNNGLGSKFNDRSTALYTIKNSYLTGFVQLGSKFNSIDFQLIYKDIYFSPVYRPDTFYENFHEKYIAYVQLQVDRDIDFKFQLLSTTY